MIKTSKDIVVGQFYHADGADGYYYVGIQFGKTKRLVVLNLQEYEAQDSKTPLFPDNVDMYEEWKFRPCTQAKVKKAKL